MPKLVSALSVPWNAFIAAFLYYTVLTLIAIGLAGLSDAFMAAAYGLPVAAYGALLLARGARALTRIEVVIAGTPHALIG